MSATHVPSLTRLAEQAPTHPELFSFYAQYGDSGESRFLFLDTLAAAAFQEAVRADQVERFTVEAVEASRLGCRGLPAGVKNVVVEAILRDGTRLHMAPSAWQKTRALLLVAIAVETLMGAVLLHKGLLASGAVVMAGAGVLLANAWTIPRATSN